MVRYPKKTQLIIKIADWQRFLPAFVWAVGSSPWVLILREFHQAFDRNLPAAAGGRNLGRLKYSKKIGWLETSG
jgi:hypothetical protein